LKCRSVLESFIRNAIRQQTGKPVKLMQFKKQLEETMELLQMDPSYRERDLNVGFSAERRKRPRFSDADAEPEILHS
jgi:Fe-S cluster assembly ATP-binding protein